MNFEFDGKCVAVLPMKSGTSQNGKEWSTQSYVFQTDSTSQYPKHIVCSVFGADKIAQFAVQQGVDYHVHFEPDARQWTSKDGITSWFGDNRAWKIEPTTAAQQPTQQQPVPADPFAPAAPAQATQQPAAPEKKDDDLPF